MSNYVPKTLDQCILEARQIVNDSQPPYRNTDETLMGYLNSGLLMIYSVRPDAFIGNFMQGVLSFQGVPQFDPTDLQTIDGDPNPNPPAPATVFPLDVRFFYNPMVVYIAGRIELADDEYVDTSRSTQLLAAMSQQLVGR